MWILCAIISVYLPKTIFVVFDLIAKIPQLIGKKRIRAISITGLIIAILTFFAVWWGALFNRFHIDVKSVDITIPSLPRQFEGYRIAQFSDIHLGTFGTDTAFVSRFVDKINSLNPDLIVFTGDIANRNSNELKPFVKVLARLKAADGVISILGNHDYGDYTDWKNDADKKNDRRLMVELQGRMGWKLLLNETRFIERAGDSIAIVGVENIGDPPFHVYGSLPEAYPTPGDSLTKILLTHNPAHWVNEISDKPAMNIPLTLSGHTHAMQMSAGDISPARLRYKTWGGLYHDKSGQHLLYVNIGAGTVGWPVRIGATPEITLLTLKRR